MLPTQELKNSISDAISAAIVSGTGAGAGQPTGILPGITWDTTNSIETASLTADNLLAAITKLPAGYAGGAKFAMSAATLFGQVYPLKNGEGDYMFTDTERGGVRRLFGFEIAHHKTHLNPANVNNPDISLNPVNLEALCLECHNTEHFSAGGTTRRGLEFTPEGDIRKEQQP